MRFDVVTLFPELFAPHLAQGITRRAFEPRQVDVRLWPLRDFAADAYRRVDDRPFGGGPGMVMLAEPLEAALAAVRADRGDRGDAAPAVVHFTPAGRAARPGAGAAARRRRRARCCCAGATRASTSACIDRHVTLEISLGDFVLSGGELPALALLDAVARLQDGRADARRRTSRTAFPTACSKARTTAGPSGWPIDGGDAAGAARCCCRATMREIARWRREQSLRADGAPAARPDRGGARRRPAVGRRRVASSLPWASASYNQRLFDPLPGTHQATRHRARHRTPCHSRCKIDPENPLDLIATLEQEEIARLNKTIPPFAPGDTVIVSVNVVEGTRKRAAGLRRRRHRQAQPRPEQQLHRAQDLQRRRRRAHLPALQPADRRHRGQAPRRRAPRQAVLPAPAQRQVGAHQGKARLSRARPRRSRGSRAADASSAPAAGRAALAPSTAAPWPARASSIRTPCRWSAPTRTCRRVPRWTLQTPTRCAQRFAERAASGRPNWPGDGARFDQRQPAAACGAGAAGGARRRPAGAADPAHRRTCATMPGRSAFPGGRAKPDDVDAAATALREAQEEVGLARRQVEVIGRLPAYTTVTTSSSRRWWPWCSRRSTLTLDPFEVDEAFEVPLAFLMTPAHHRRHAFERRRRAAPVPVDALAGPAPTARRANTSSGAPPRRCCATCTASCAR